MNILKKINRFIKRIYVDYSEIDRIFDEKLKALKNDFINNNESLKKEFNIESEKRSEDIIRKINYESQKREDNIFRQINDNYKLLNASLEKENMELKKQLDIEKEELNMLKNQLTYSNAELLNIKHDNNLKNILIIGFFGAPNLGDEMMLETLLEYLDKVPNKKITVLLADNPEYSIDKYKEIKFIHYPKSLNDFNIIAEKFDYIIFGGGAIIDDKNYNKEKSYQYDLGTMLIKLSIRAIAFNKKVICIALSATENITNPEYIEKLKYIIKNTSYFSVRDEFTKKYLTEKLGEQYGEKINQIYDIVFSNKDISSNLIEIRNKKDTFNIGIIAISNDENYKKIQIIIEAIKKLNKNAQINLIPFYDYKHMDINFYNKIINNNMDLSINVEKYPENMNQTIDLYKKNDIIIGMRYHSILIAYALNIPCISICYDIHAHYPYKIKYLNQLFDKKEALSYINFDEDELYNELNNISSNYDNNKDLEISKKILIEANEQMKEIINTNFD